MILCPLTKWIGYEKGMMGCCSQKLCLIIAPVRLRQTQLDLLVVKF